MAEQQVHCPECGSYTKNGCGAAWHDSAPETTDHGCARHGWDDCPLCEVKPWAGGRTRPTMEHANLLRLEADYQTMEAMGQNLPGRPLSDDGSMDEVTFLIGIAAALGAAVNQADPVFKSIDVLAVRDRIGDRIASCSSEASMSPSGEKVAGPTAPIGMSRVDLPCPRCGSKVNVSLSISPTITYSYGNGPTKGFVTAQVAIGGQEHSCEVDRVRSDEIDREGNRD